MLSYVNGRLNLVLTLLSAAFNVYHTQLHLLCIVLTAGLTELELPTLRLWPFVILPLIRGFDPSLTATHSPAMMMMMLLLVWCSINIVLRNIPTV